MKLLIVTGIFPPDSGGPASYVPRIAKEFVRLGHNVEVVCWSDRLDHGQEIYPFPVHRISRKTFKPCRYFRTTLTIARKARDKDLIYVNGLSFEAMLAAKLTGKRTVHKIVGDYAWERARNHGWFAGSLEDYQAARKGLRLRLIDWLRTVPCRRAEKIIVPSRFLKKIVTGWRIPEERIEVIYNALPSEMEQSDGALPRSEMRTVITVCRLVAWKGVDQIIELLPELPSVRLLIAGDGPLRAHLEEISARLGVAARVLFLGQISQAQVSTFLRKSDAFILNSSYEGLPHVVLEAMAAGVPVVATDVGGTGELVTDKKTGLLVPFGDRAKLKSAILAVLGDPALAASLVREAKRLLEAHFGFRTMVEATEDILKTATPEPLVL